MNKVKHLVLPAIIGFIAFASPYAASAYGSSGWFMPFASVVGTTDICSDEESSISIQLVEQNSNSPIAGNVERWRVHIRGADGQIVNGQTVIGNNQSNPICFNPATQGIQTIVYSSPANNYRPITTPTMYVDPSLVSMPGHHFRGLVHLKPITSPQDDFAVVSPNGLAVNRVPDFGVQTNTMPSMYGVSAVNQIRLYLINQITGSRASYAVPTFGGVGYRLLTGIPDTLSEGTYLWTFNQNFNGSQTINSPESLLNWTFDSVPVTGASSLSSFVIDRTNPVNVEVSKVVALSQYDVNSTVVNVTTQAQDITSGLRETVLYVTDSADVVLSAIPVEHSVSPLSSIAPLDLQVTNFQIGLPHNQTYRFYITAIDDAGNTTTSEVLEAFVPRPTDISLPLLNNVSATDIGTNQVTVNANIANTGGAAVTRRGTCWSLVNSTETEESLPTFSTDPTRCIESQDSDEGFPAGVFAHTHQGLPADTEIFYYAYVENMAGLLFSDLLSFDTLPSAFAPGSEPVPPTVSLIQPQLVYSDSALIGGRINSIGGDPVNLRSVCWSLSPFGATPPPPAWGEEPTYCMDATYTCPDGTVVSPNSDCEFICPTEWTPEEYSVFGDESFGMGGAELGGDESDTCLGVIPICPDGSTGTLDFSCNVICDSEEPTCPFMIRCEEGFTTVFDEDGCPAYCAFEGSNSSCPAGAFMCPDGTVVERAGASCEFSCPTTGGGPTCQNWPGSLPVDATLPFSFSNRFAGLPSNTLIYYRVYAGNTFGVATVDGTFTTAPLEYDFATTGSFEVVSVFNDETETFTVTVPVSALDLTNEISGFRRTVRYRVEQVSQSGTVVNSVEGTIPTSRTSAPLTFRSAVFNNVERGVWIFRINLNTEPVIYPEPLSKLSNNSVSSLVYLINPNSVSDLISGVSGGTGPTLPDPGISINQPNIIIRSGNQTDISWDVVETYPMDCRIEGPPTFATNGVYTFNPATDGPTGSISTGPLANAQIFRLTCFEPVTNSTFSTTTRVNVTGSIREL